MNFTFNWLSEFVGVRMTPEKLAELLTMAGLEVESLTRITEPETHRPDWLFTIGVTPNRGDCLGIQGIAREVAALTGERLRSLPVKPRAKTPGGAKMVDVSIDDPRLCARYSARLVTGITVSPSLDWLRFRLEACGIRAINNIVDITNYVMLETGQPLHAFDFDLLPARHIVVRPAGRPVKFTTLDGHEQELIAEDLLICDGDVAVALAGIMGGMNSEVSRNTTSILLESASFDPITVRRTAKRLALHSEASHRFERGVDPEGTLAALERVAALLTELAGAAAPVRGVVDRYPRPAKPLTIPVRQERIEALLGVAIARKAAEKHFRSLGIKTTRRAGNVIDCSPPPSRPDLTREADLLEELARLYGYDKIPATLPRLRPAGRKDELLRRERALRSFLAGEGLVEVINLPFTNRRLNRALVGLWEGAEPPVVVINPLTKESGELRLSLLPGLIENLRANLAQKAVSFRAYHLGKVFRMAPGARPHERLYLSGILYGSRPRIGLLNGAEHAPGFLDCKGLVEGLFDSLRIGAPISWSDQALEALHPGRQALAELEGQRLGYLGQLHPELGDELGLPQFLVFELDLEKLLEYAPRTISVRNLPRFPSVGRDFAVVVERDFQSHQIISWINSRGDALIEHVEVFDEYRGAPIPEDKKSLAYKISYRAEDRTLTDAEINTLHQNLVSEISKVFGAELRS